MRSISIILSEEDFDFVRKSEVFRFCVTFPFSLSIPSAAVVAVLGFLVKVGTECFDNEGNSIDEKEDGDAKEDLLSSSSSL